MEPTTGIEPVNLFLTKEVLYRLSYVGGFYCIFLPEEARPLRSERIFRSDSNFVERETGFEPATLSLEG